MRARQAPLVCPIQWGESEIGGPKHYYRETLMIRCLKPPFRGRALDAGCGGGSFALKLARLGFLVEAIDASPSFVDMVNRKARVVGLGGSVNACVGNITDIPYPGGTFDLVVCGEVLEHIDDDGRAVKEFARVLKSGGTCIATVPAKPELWSICDDWAGHKRRYVKSELVDLFKSSGFEIVSAKCWGFPLVLTYERLVFRRYAARMAIKAPSDRANNWIKRIGNSAVVSAFLGNLFNVDNLFDWCGRGLGLILVSRKSS